MRTHVLILVAYITPAINAILRGEYSEHDICYLRKAKGYCKQWTSRFYHNPISGKCERFWYSGCLGNDNNFVTYRECQRRCAPSRYAEEIHKHGPNLFLEETVRIPLNAACLQPKHSGHCHRSLRHFYYNNTAGRCEEFTYTGCGGTKNNFPTFEICHSMCSTGPRVQKDPCTLPRRRGPCTLWRTRYSYDTENKTCTKFLYGGCLGSSNNFRSLRDCQERCMNEETEKKDVCSLPQEAGDCNDWLFRYAFNRHYGECQVFLYGGCNGNENNFETEEECNKTCPKREPEQGEVCSLPPEKGPCTSYSIRFYYDITRERCGFFLYGGCMGNANNFDTYKQCEVTCLPK